MKIEVGKTYKDNWGDTWKVPSTYEDDFVLVRDEHDDEGSRYPRHITSVGDDGKGLDTFKDRYFQLLPNTIKKEGWVVWYHGREQIPGPTDDWEDCIEQSKEYAEDRLKWWCKNRSGSHYSLAFLSLEMPDSD